MSKEVLQNIIDDFSVDKFQLFFRRKSNKFRFPNEPIYEESENFTDGLKIAEAKFEDGKLIVCAFLSKQDLSERSGKKSQYEIGKKILRYTDTDAGIFIFYDAQGSFRFSLIYTNYLGRCRDWSNYRRFTYFVSKQLTNKTFLQRIGEGDFSTLEKIKEAFSVEKVTKEFYQEIANWYFWAVKECKFPPAAEQEENGRNIAIIRLITRMIFIWFMKVRQLIPDDLFKEDKIKDILNDISRNKSTYYKAILQNLFFATLNTEIKERRFREPKRYNKGWNKDFAIQYVYRFHGLFKDSSKIEEYFKKIPFLNGGLFECLDNGRKNIYIDGFTERKKYQPYVPNFLFFQEEKEIDLNEEYGTKGKRYKVRGLINILSSYNFTIDENEPDDLEVALDPELLGRVFENLLASYNPETATTARKATGSYYTPREIVDYMVTQSLKYYFKTHLSDIPDVEEKLSQLFSKENYDNPFDSITTKKLISLIESLRVVDPAVGSGAFPMGILNKLVFILSKLDPQNTLWKEAQIEAIKRDVKDPILKEKLIQQAEEHFKNKDINYLRKLYLIEKCIYGVDIQQIAVEIAKLRFFISLLVDEKIDKTKPNWGIEPLPNLDFKLMQGNSLISSFAGIDFGEKKQSEDKGQLFLGFTSKYDNLIKEFEEIKHQYQNEPDKDKKDKLREKIEELILQIFEEKIAQHFPQLKRIEEKYKSITDFSKRAEFIAKEKTALYKKLGFDLEQAQKDLITYTEGRKPKNFFLWDIYFAEVFMGENPGFDIVIANPPYGNILKDQEKKDINKFYNFSTTKDISSPFIEKGVNLLKNKGNLVYIITYAITFNKDFSRNRQLLRDSFEKIEILSFDRDRCRIFESMTQSVSIMKCFNKNSPVKKGIFTSKMFRDTPDIYQIEVNNCDEFLHPQGITYYSHHRLPKIGERLNLQILRKLLSNKNIVANVIKNNGRKIWIRTSGNYWYNAFDRKPYNSVEIKSLVVAREYDDFIILLMNTSLFYFWCRIYGDGRHMNMDLLEGFPLPCEELIFQYKVLLSKMRVRFMGKLFSVFDKPRSRFITSQIKDEIDMVDLILGRYFYHLSYSEIMHILNYDSEIRGGCKLPSSFMNIINQILFLTQSEDYLENPQKQAKVKEYEREIDQLVYKLYGLIEEEIRIVEGGI